ncbi:hypothetical protein ACHAQJ_005529 [Trichoderma viride]
MPSPTTQSFDAVIIGAGFGGIYQLYKLRQLGLPLSVKLIEKAPEIGGAWYWNQYPNCASDSPSELYRYSWDKEDLKTYPWPNHVVTQEETLAYLKHVVKRHDLRKDMQFSTEIKSTTFDASTSTWTLQTATGETIKTTYLIAATGAIHKANWPALPGRDKFKGEQLHAGVWPDKQDFEGKRVGIIGTGSSGAQLVVGVAREAKHVTSFQRSAQYIVPNYRGAVAPEYRDNIVNNYDEVWKGVRNCVVGYNFKPITTPTFSVSEEERERVFEAAWSGKNGFAFLYATFSDVLTNEAANREICNFIKRKIASIVKDPKKRETLTPAPDSFYAKRPVCCAGYYETFNRDNVDVVDFKKTPLVEITENGIRTDDKLYELDVIIWATGYETDGSWLDLGVTGPKETLDQHWANGATSYLGMSETGFPNFFLIVGPQSPVTNMPPLVEAQSDLIAGLITKAETLAKERKKKVLIEATKESEDEFMNECRKLGDESIFKKEKSFLYGDNTLSRNKGRNVLWYFGGMNTYLGKVNDELNNDFRGFSFSS